MRWVLGLVVKRLRSSDSELGENFHAAHAGPGMCCWLLGCSNRPVLSDQAAAKQLLSDTLQAWKSGKSPEDLKTQSPPVYVNDARWSKGAKLVEFTITSEGEYHQSSVRMPVQMKLDKDTKPRESYYWVSTNPANSITLGE